MEQLRLPGELTAGMIRTAAPVPAAARPVIGQLRAAGLGWSAIARQLNTAAVPTPSGRGAWYSETVMRHYDPARHAAYMRDYRARRRILGDG